MIIENTTRHKLRSRWNRYLKQEVLDIELDGEWCALGSLVQGVQYFSYGIVTTTTLPRAPVRTECDLQLATTRISEDC